MYIHEKKNKQIKTINFTKLESKFELYLIL